MRRTGGHGRAVEERKKKAARGPLKVRSDVIYFDSRQVSGRRKGAQARRWLAKDAHVKVAALQPPPPPPPGTMISTSEAVGRRRPSAARRSERWIAWCQAALLGVSALVIAAERSARKCGGGRIENDTRARSGSKETISTIGVIFGSGGCLFI